MGIKYNLSETDLIKIRENYGKIPNLELLKLLECDYTRGMLVYTAKQLGIRKTRDAVIKTQLTTTHEKILHVLDIIENKQSNSLEDATQKVNIHISTFCKSIKKYPKLLERFDNISWNSVFDLHCNTCGESLTIDNYRRFDNITTSRGANKYRFRRCDACYKKVNKKNIDNFNTKIGRIFLLLNLEQKIKI